MNETESPETNVSSPRGVGVDSLGWKWERFEMEVALGHWLDKPDETVWLELRERTHDGSLARAFADMHLALFCKPYALLQQKAIDTFHHLREHGHSPAEREHATLCLLTMKKRLQTSDLWHFACNLGEIDWAFWMRDAVQNSLASYLLDEVLGTWTCFLTNAGSQSAEKCAEIWAHLPIELRAAVEALVPPERCPSSWKQHIAYPEVDANDALEMEDIEEQIRLVTSDETFARLQRTLERSSNAVKGIQDIPDDVGIW